MCLATGEAAGANLYEALRFQHSLGQLEPIQLRSLL
jgi:hypothetical protein